MDDGCDMLYWKYQGNGVIDLYDMTAQVIGLVAMFFNVVSYQSKSRKNVILLQLVGSLLFTVNMFMLGAVMGTVLNFVGTVRAIIYSDKEKIRNIKAVNCVFIGIFILSYIASFTVLGTDFNFRNLAVEIMPVVAMVATTLAFSMKDAASIRKLTLLSSPLWLLYDVINKSVGGSLCELFTLASAITGIIRLDMKRGSKNENTES